MPIRRMVRAAAIAAVYVALCLVLAPLSFGPVQLRFAEALTLLPVLCPEAVLGVTLGCFLSNLIASAPLDMVVGTAATLLAALATRRLRNVRLFGLPLAASLPPVVINAGMVGAELAFLYAPAGARLAAFPLYAGGVGAGQLASCCVVGVLLVWGIERQPKLRQLFTEEGEIR